MLNVKQESYEYQLLKSFGLTRSGDRTLVYRLRSERSNHWKRSYKHGCIMDSLFSRSNTSKLCLEERC